MKSRRMGVLVAAFVAIVAVIAVVNLGAAEPKSDQAAAAPAPVPAPLPIDVMDAFPLGAGESDDASLAGDYCTYVIVTAAGPACGPFTPGATICVNCPGSGSCPGPAGGQRSRYRYLGADGNVKCKGQWVKRYDVVHPNACINCPEGGETGFVFVN